MGAGGLQADAGSERVEAYLDYLIESGSNYRWGPGWRLDAARTDRIARERNLIAEMGFSAYFIILYDVMRQCRDMGVITGPGRGSVCSSLLCYVLRIHEIDSLERGLIFERFMTRDRVSYPDVDIDVSQAARDQVLEYVADAYTRDGNVVLAVGAFARNGARRVVDIMLNARSRDDEEAGRTATLLKQCLPEGNITGGAKVDRELSWWLEKGHGDRDKFRDLATKAGWLDTMLKLDGTFSNLGRHAAGVMILSADDMRRLPTTSVDGKLEMTGFDMYALEKLGYPKYDFLGLRTLDVVSDARKLEGHSGSIDDLMTLWRDHNHDPDPYRALHEGDTLGIFQMETPGYRRTVQEMKPDKFEHLVQLNALYRPGALDAKAEDGRTMVQVFLDRHRAKEKATYPVPEMKEVLAHTHGVLLFQEDTMRIARQLCGFDDATADMLRRAIGKKRHKEMMALEERFVEGWVQGGRSREMGQRLWENVVAASRYSWARCLAANTQIATADGARSISQVRKGDWVMSVGSEGFASQPVRDVHYNGVRPLLSVECDEMVELVGTPNHRLLAEEGYKRMDELVAGDRLQVSHRFSPVSGVQVFAGVVTSMAEGDEIPGWVISYDGERNDVMHWQFVPAVRLVREFGQAADLAFTTISFSDVFFESTIPRNSGVKQICSSVTGGDTIGTVFPTRVLDRSEACAFFRRAKHRAQSNLDGAAVESESLPDLFTGHGVFQIEPAHFREELLDSSSVADQPVLDHEAREGGRGAAQIQYTHDVVVRPARFVELQNLLGTLPQLVSCLRGESLPVAGDETPNIASGPLGVAGQWLTTPAFTEFWDGIHVDIVPGLVSVRNVRNAGRGPVYDLEMPSDHNFVAQHVVSHNSHSEPYSIITWLCMYLRYYTPAAFMSALINSYSKDKDRMVDAVSSARERVHLIPPDINQTQEGFGVEDGQMLFGLRGIKGMGAANRLEILRERDANGSFASFDDFCLRLPSVPVPMKLSLVRAGAFDNLVSRELLMATCPKKGKSDAQWTVAEHLNHNRTLKNPRPIPDIEELHFPTDEEMAEAERDTTGFYVSRSPLGEVEAVLRRCDTAKTIGGRIESIQRKKDRRGQEMAMIRLLTPDLKQRRVIIFASNWPALKPHMNKGEQWIMRGRHDGDSFLAEVAWPPYDMGHFRRAEVTHPDSSTESVRLNGGTSDLVAAWEAQGCSVRLR